MRYTPFFASSLLILASCQTLPPAKEVASATSAIAPCSFDGLFEEGLEDGFSGNEAKDVDVRFSPCSIERRKRLARVYLDGYNGALLQLCSESNIEAEGRKAALGGTSVPPSPKLSICFTKFPELKQSYEAGLSLR